MESARYLLIFNENGDPSVSRSKIKPIIKSYKINNELLSSLFAKNYDQNNIIVEDQLAYGHRTPEMISILSRLGTFQFGCDIDAGLAPNDEFEYTTLLSSLDATSINVEDIYNSKEVYHYPTYIAIVDGYPNEDTVVDWIQIPINSSTQNIICNSLLLLVSSPSNIIHLSEEIHDNSYTPHADFDNLVLFTKDLSKYQSIAFLNGDLIELKSGIKLGDYFDPWTDIVIPNVVSRIYDIVADQVHNNEPGYERYIIDVNGKMVCRSL